MSHLPILQFCRVLASCLSLAALAGCSAAPSNSAAAEVATDGGNDGGSRHDGSPTADGSVCSYAPITNDSACPATYSYGLSGKPCAPVGMMCGYPGVGDGTADGCFSTAALWCRADADAGDGGADAGGGTWIAAQ